MTNGTNLARRHMPALIEMVGRHIIGGENAVKYLQMPADTPWRRTVDLGVRPAGIC